MPFTPGRGVCPAGMKDEEWTSFISFGSDRTIHHLTGEEHAFRRRWITKTFSNEALARWRESIMIPTLHSELDAFVNRGRAELVTEFADPVTPRMFHRMLGLPVDPDFVTRSNELASERFLLKQRQTECDSRPNRELVDRAWAATEEIKKLIEPHVLARQDGTGDDFISMVWRDADDLFGAGWGLEHVLGEILIIWGAGAGTTLFGMVNQLYLLMKQPDLQDQLRSGGGNAIKAFVEESLRLYGPIVQRPRWALRDVELGGQTIKKGDQVVAIMVAAGRDGQQHACPMQVDLERKGLRTHFSFWQGQHACPGAGVARAMLEVTIEAVLERMYNLRLDPDAAPPRFRYEVTRRWEPLYALFDAA